MSPTVMMILCAQISSGGSGCGVFSGIYEALLDSFSPGMKDATIAREFAMLERELPALIRSARQKRDSEPAYETIRPSLACRRRWRTGRAAGGHQVIVAIIEGIWQ